jgi:RND family efflux transporter MFP subunit
MTRERALGLGFLGLVVAALAVFLLMKLGREPEPSPGEAEAQSSDTKDPASHETNPQNPTRPVPVAVQVLRTGQATAAVRAWGTVQPFREAAILAELTGRVTAVHVQLGDEVKAGQVLLEIDPELHAARVREAETAVASAKTAQETASKELSRREALFQRGSISDSELEAARTKAAEADASLAAAQTALEQARKNLSIARLRAPFGGHVASRPPDVGSTVSLGAPLLAVVDIGRLHIEALISEQDLPRVRVSDEATITVEGAPGRAFSGSVTAIGPQADIETRQFPVEIEVGNPPDLPLRGGMVARVEIVYESFDDLPLLPVDALIEDEEGYFFFAIRNGVAQRRSLVPGPREGQHIAVRGGAAAGDTVVVLGQDRLAQGSPVRVEEVR